MLAAGELMCLMKHAKTLGIGLAVAVFSAAPLQARVSEQELAKQRLAAEGITSSSYADALFVAIRDGDDRRLALLLDAGCDPDMMLLGGWMPLHAACCLNNPRAVRALLDAGADCDAEFLTLTPLHYTAIMGNDVITLMLLSADADPDKKTSDGFTPLHLACANVDSELQKTEDDVREFTDAVLNGQSGRISVVQHLLTYRADPNAADKSMMTPLTVAAQGGQTEVIEILRVGGADASLRDDKGMTALHHAAAGGLYPALEDYRRNFKREEGYAALGRLLSRHHRDYPKAVQLLLNTGSDIHARSKRNCTPLHDAAIMNNVNVARVLINHGADVNAESDPGAPIHLAVLLNHTEMVDVLLAAGADLTVEDDEGRTPLEIAEQEGYQVIAAKLRAAGA